MNRCELSQLLYLESRATDYGGAVDMLKMNGADLEITDRWAEDGYIQWGRIAAKDIKVNRVEQTTHWVKLSAAAHADASKERRARAERCFAEGYEPCGYKEAEHD